MMRRQMVTSGCLAVPCLPVSVYLSVLVSQEGLLVWYRSWVLEFWVGPGGQRVPPWYGYCFEGTTQFRWGFLGSDVRRGEGEM